MGSVEDVAEDDSQDRNQNAPPHLETKIAKK